MLGTTPDALEPFRIALDNAGADPGTVRAPKSFLQHNDLTMPLDMVPCAQEIQRQLGASMKDVKMVGPKNMRKFAEHVGKAIAEHLLPEWVQCASAAMALTPAAVGDGSFSAVQQGVSLNTRRKHYAQCLPMADVLIRSHFGSSIFSRLKFGRAG